MIKKRLRSDRYLLIKSAHYPYRSPDIRKRVRHKAIIGVGGNLGDVVRRFEHLYYFLKKRSKSVVLRESAPILRNPPFGFLEQPDFYNTVLVLDISMTPRGLLRFLLHTEKRFGRRRTRKDGPRTLDLDILFYDAVKIDSKRLKIPHPEWMNRDSVLIPLMYLKGDK